MGLSGENQSLVSSFLEITSTQSAETAVQFLQASSWRLEEALSLFYGSETDMPAPYLAPCVNVTPTGWDSDVAEGSGRQYADVSAPLPVKREILYDADASNRRQSQTIADSDHDVWVSNQSVGSSSNGSDSNLAALYRQPFSIMFNGSFEKAKIEASLRNKWLIVNVQSTEEFSSHMLNRDTWANESVEQLICSNFIFWQIFHDAEEGKKVCTYYHLVSLPAVLIIDPITGGKLCARNGMIQPEDMSQILLGWMDGGPQEHNFIRPQKRSKKNSETSNPPILDEIAEEASASVEDLEDRVMSINIGAEAKFEYILLPDEPKDNRELLCRVAIRFPDGRRFQRNFLRKDPIKLLWSFCCTQLEEQEAKRPFQFTQSTLCNGLRSVSYESDLTFEEAGICDSLILLVWDY